MLKVDQLIGSLTVVFFFVRFSLAFQMQKSPSKISLCVMHIDNKAFFFMLYNMHVQIIKYML